MSLLNPIKTFEFMTHRAYDVRLCRRCSTFDGRCRTSKLLQPLNMIPHGEIQHKSPRKFEDISSKSSRLLVDLGFVRPASPGTFVFLNMAMRSLEKLTSLADVVMEQAGCQKILLPTLVLHYTLDRWDWLVIKILTCVNNEIIYESLWSFRFWIGYKLVNRSFNEYIKMTNFFSIFDYRNKIRWRNLFFMTVYCFIWNLCVNI